MGFDVAMAVKLFFARRQLLWRTLGAVLLVNGIRLAIYYGTEEKFNGYFPIEACSSFFSGAIFVMAIIVNGVFADFKESERIHGEIATYLENIYETIEMYAVAKDIDSLPLLKNLQLMTRRIFIFLRDVEDPNVTDHFWTEMTLLVKAMTYPIEKAGLTPVALRMWSYGTDQMRQRLMRIERIAQTTFIATGYTLFDMCVLAVLTIVILARYSSGIAMAHCVITITTMLFVYISLLVRDVDDPFNYSAEDLDPDHLEMLPILFAGRTEVDPRPILTFYRRLTAWIAAIEVSKQAEAAKKEGGASGQRAYQAALAKLPALGHELGHDIRRRFVEQAKEARNVFDNTDALASSPVLGSSSREVVSTPTARSPTNSARIVPEDDPNTTHVVAVEAK